MRNDEAIGSGAYNGILGIYKNEGGYSSQVMSIVDNFGRRSRIERGRISDSAYEEERRSGRDRRNGTDRS
jgi:hypothetical protein